MSNRWKPTADKEIAKLAPKEDDWSVAGVGVEETPQPRTRRKRTFYGDSPEQQQQQQLNLPVHAEGDDLHPLLSDDDSTTCYDGDDDSLDSWPVDDDVKAAAKSKPPPSRVTLEADPLKDFIYKYCKINKCPKCNCAVEIDMSTTTITSKVEINCLNPDCEWATGMDDPAKTTINKDEDDNYERMTDHSANALFALAFLFSGDGGTEAGKLLGLLGPPNDATMEGRTFGITEDDLVQPLDDIAKKTLEENIIEEVKASNPVDVFERWHQVMFSPDIGPAPKPLEENECPIIDASFDEGWQQRSAGHKRNSPSGHGLFFGRVMRKPLCIQIKSKLCNFCAHHNKKNEKRKSKGEAELPAPDHRHWKNWDLSSGAMEARTCLENIIHLHRDMKVKMGKIACDDDASTRSVCRWDNATWQARHPGKDTPDEPITKGPRAGEMQPRKDHGKPPADAPEPEFVADLNHRAKLFTGELMALDKAKVKLKHGMTRMDSTRLGENFKCVARTLKNAPRSKWPTASMAVIHHHFDTHNNCGAWCKRKHMTEEEKKRSEKYCRSLPKHKEPHDRLCTMQKATAR